MPDISLATYASLADVRRLLNEPQDRNPDDHQADIQIMEALRFATRYIETQTRRDYLPRVETRYFSVGFPALGAEAGGYWLEFGEDNRAIEITGVTNGDGSTISSSDYRLYPREGAPYTAIRLSVDAWETDVTYGGRDAVAIAGRWEDSDRNAANWLAGYDAVQNNPLAIDGTSVTVAWATDYDPARRTPRFSPGQLLRLGTSSSAEYVALLDTNPIIGGTSTLTVRRAERGTTAAAWAQNTAIAAWEVDANIKQACAELARWRYKNAGNGEDAIPAGIKSMIDGVAPRWFVLAV